MIKWKKYKTITLRRRCAQCRQHIHTRSGPVYNVFVRDFLPRSFLPPPIRSVITIAIGQESCWIGEFLLLFLLFNKRPYSPTGRRRYRMIVFLRLRRRRRLNSELLYVFCCYCFGFFHLPFAVVKWRTTPSVFSSCTCRFTVRYVSTNAVGAASACRWFGLSFKLFVFVQLPFIVHAIVAHASYKSTGVVFSSPFIAFVFRLVAFGANIMDELRRQLRSTPYEPSTRTFIEMC